MAKTIYLKDYSPVKDEYTDLCKDLQKEIDKSSSEIFVINGNDKPKVFDCSYNNVCVMNYAGVLVDGQGNKFIIGSRFDERNNDGKGNNCFLQYLLENASDSVNFYDMNVGGYLEEFWNYLLSVMYINKLKKALHTGTFRKYRQFFCDDSKPKGQIDIARHLRLNGITRGSITNNGKIAYNAREYTEKNYYNILFLRAFDIVRKKYPEKRSLSLRFDEKRDLDSLRCQNAGWNAVNTRTVLRETDRKIVHNIYGDYEQLRVLSRLIIRNMGANVFSGEENKVCGMLIDISKLWEDFLYNAAFKEIGAEAQKEFSILDGRRKIIPDFCFKEKGLVLDAKYKTSWSEKWSEDEWNKETWEKYDTIREDVFQVLAYMMSLDFDNGGVVFPTNQEGTKVQLSVYANGIKGNKDKFFYCIPVFVPKHNEYKEYDDYSSKMDERMRSIKEDIKNKIHNH